MGRSIGTCSIEQAELWGINDALLLAWDFNWENIIIETDCAQAIVAISNKSHGRSNRDLVIRIKELCQRRWIVILKHIPREANCAAHILAGTMQNKSFGFTRFTDIPIEIIEQIRSDEHSTL